MSVTTTALEDWLRGQAELLVHQLKFDQHEGRPRRLQLYLLLAERITDCEILLHRADADLIIKGRTAIPFNIGRPVQDVPYSNLYNTLKRALEKTTWMTI